MDPGDQYIFIFASLLDYVVQRERGDEDYFRSSLKSSPSKLHLYRNLPLRQ